MAGVPGRTPSPAQWHHRSPPPLAPCGPPLLGPSCHRWLLLFEASRPDGTTSRGKRGAGFFSSLCGSHLSSSVKTRRHPSGLTRRPPLRPLRAGRGCALGWRQPGLVGLEVGGTRCRGRARRRPGRAVWVHWGHRRGGPWRRCQKHAARSHDRGPAPASPPAGAAPSPLTSASGSPSPRGCPGPRPTEVVSTRRAALLPAAPCRRWPPGGRPVSRVVQGWRTQRGCRAAGWLWTRRAAFLASEQ